MDTTVARWRIPQQADLRTWFPAQVSILIGLRQRLADEKPIDDPTSQGNTADTRHALHREKERPAEVQRPHDRQTEREPNQHHAQNRTASKYRNVQQPFYGAFGRRHDEQQQGRRAGQPMGHPDAQRPHRFLPPVPMTVMLGKAMTVEMHVPHAVMIVAMEVPPFANQLYAEQPAEPDEHESYDDFRRHGEWFGDRNTEDQDDRSDYQKNGGMSDPPAEAD